MSKFTSRASTPALVGAADFDWNGFLRALIRERGLRGLSRDSGFRPTTLRSWLLREPFDPRVSEAEVLLSLRGGGLGFVQTPTHQKGRS